MAIVIARRPKADVAISHILLKDFCGWVNGLTGLIRDSCETRAGQLGIEVPLFLEMDSCLRRNDKRNSIFTSLRTCCPCNFCRLCGGVRRLIFSLFQIVAAADDAYRGDEHEYSEYYYPMSAFA